MNYQKDDGNKWGEIVEGVRAGDEDSARALYEALAVSARGILGRTMGQGMDRSAVDDRVQEIMMIVLEAIRRGAIREPERLMGFVRTIIRRGAIAEIRNKVESRRRLVALGAMDYAAPASDSPEAQLARRERESRMAGVLDYLCARDREIIVRFYIGGQDPEQICQEMKLTHTQFRLYKSRAIARCGKIAQLHPRRLESLRPSVASSRAVTDRPLETAALEPAATERKPAARAPERRNATIQMSPASRQMVPASRPKQPRKTEQEVAPGRLKVA